MSKVYCVSNLKWLLAIGAVFFGIAPCVGQRRHERGELPVSGFQSKYDALVKAYWAKQWQAYGATLAPDYALDTMDGERIGRKEWMESLRQQRIEHPSNKVGFTVRSAAQRKSRVEVKVVDAYHFTYLDTWTKTRAGWRLTRSRMTGVEQSRRR